jgi:hypothetical protein
MRGKQKDVQIWLGNRAMRPQQFKASLLCGQQVMKDINSDINNDEDI